MDELHLSGRLYTWTNEREHPTLECLDRLFASADWFSAYPNHGLRALSTDCSDHCPLLLSFNLIPWAGRRFRFESFWTSLEGFLEVVAIAWQPTLLHADPFRVLDYKLRNTARALRSWSMRKIGSVRLQLAMAREVVLRFDEAQDSRQLTGSEAELRRRFKLRVLGLASLNRSIARQRSRILFMREGDANTRFFNLQACHRSRKSFIASLSSGDVELVQNEDMAQAIFQHFSALMGSSFTRSTSFALETIGLPSVDLSELDHLFSEDEIWLTVADLPDDKAPGPDGFTGRFYKRA